VKKHANRVYCRCYYRRSTGWPHIVIAFGKIIKLYEKLLYSLKNKKVAGFLLVVFTIITCVIPIAFLLYLSYKISILLFLFINGLICWQCLAMKSLKDETYKVYVKLKDEDIKAARYAVSMVVGRDTENLDEEGIIKATVETVAENTSDGIGAPLLYMGIFGCLGAYIYKVVNTMDSMIGYKNEKYYYFGFFAAKLDDVLNYLPSRITAFGMIAASFITGFDYKNALYIFKRDRRKHASPNSAQTESVMAGALNVRLAGDAYYFGKLHKKEYIGDSKRHINREDIINSHRLMYATSFVLFIALAIFRLMLFIKLRNFFVLLF